MKQIFTIIIVTFLNITIWAQSPEKMSYQAVIRDKSEHLVTNQKIGMRISMLQSSTSGTAIYIETQTPTTNANGLLSIEIGTGTTNDDFSEINWENGPYFIKTETDLAGGTNYTISGISQLLSVPYAFHANTASSLIKQNNLYYPDGLSNIQPIFLEIDSTNSYTVPSNRNLHIQQLRNNNTWSHIIINGDTTSFMQIINTPLNEGDIISSSDTTILTLNGHLVQPKSTAIYISKYSSFTVPDNGNFYVTNFFNDFYMDGIKQRCGSSSGCYNVNLIIPGGTTITSDNNFINVIGYFIEN